MDSARFSQPFRRAASYLRRTRAVSALEYAILAGVIAVALAAAAGYFGNKVTEAINTIGDSIQATANNVGS